MSIQQINIVYNERLPKHLIPFEMEHAGALGAPAATYSTPLQLDHDAYIGKYQVIFNAPLELDHEGYVGRYPLQFSLPLQLDHQDVFIGSFSAVATVPFELSGAT